MGHDIVAERSRVLLPVHLLVLLQLAAIPVDVFGLFPSAIFDASMEVQQCILNLISHQEEEL